MNSRSTSLPRFIRIAAAVLLPAAIAGIVGAAPSETGAVLVRPAACEIVTEAQPNAVVQFAVAELQKHLALVSGVPIATGTQPAAGRFPIHVGIRPPDDRAPLAPEEARWRITSEGVWLYGDDRVNQPAASPLATAVLYANRTGSLFAVYEFLERCFGIRWLEPGDAGIAYRKMDSFTLPYGSGNWQPAMQQRHIRPAYRDAGDPDGIDLRQTSLATGNVPARFIMKSETFLQRRDDEQVWHRRMRMGNPEPFTYGHAFTQWWYRYGKTHPEFFALNRQGKREPSPEIMQGAPERIKMCVSNPDLVREVVRQHFAAHGGPVINACENDSRGFCRCEQCLAWDALRPGEEKLDVDERPLTDRYLRFINAVEAEAKKYDPKARTVFYAYSQYKSPPRREKVGDGVIVFFITSHFNSDAELQAYYDAWKQAGAKEAYLRPNDMCDDTGLPLGFEENMFEKMQLARRAFQLVGTDYDCNWGFWPVSGMTHYIMARAFYRPDESFAHWEDDYCDTFGAARDDVRAYYRYWRQIWNQRIQPNRERIVRLSGRVKEVREKLMQLTDLLYSEQDFDATDALLATAVQHDVAPEIRTRIQTLQLANQHSRLTYRAWKANELFSRATADEKTSATRTLLDFRRQHRDDLYIDWELMFYIENVYNDVGGTLRLSGQQGKRLADWGDQMAESIRKVRSPEEPPLR